MLIVIVSVAVILAVCLITCVWMDVHKYNEIHRKSMSFMESLNLTDLPIVTFLCNGKKLNFVLDTGNSNSIIDKNILSNIPYKKLNLSTKLFDGSGNQRDGEDCKVELSYKDQMFDLEFMSLDMSPIFDKIKNSTGVQVNGVLGSDFFKDYKYVIDFNELIAYSKK